jgi:hypothetical protein
VTKRAFITFDGGGILHHAGNMAWYASDPWRAENKLKISRRGAAWELLLELLLLDIDRDSCYRIARSTVCSPDSYQLLATFSLSLVNPRDKHCSTRKHINPDPDPPGCNIKRILEYSQSIEPPKYQSFCPRTMATQQVLAEADAQPKTVVPAITLPPGFYIQSVDSKHNPAGTSLVPSAAAPPLGVLSNFTGKWAGTGFNLIFRPNGFPITKVDFPEEVKNQPTPPNEQVLQLNLTEETLTFSPSLGDVPNRGLGFAGQGDISLNGIPYVQSINDVTNIKTGKADGTPTPIHFEPGLWMHVPATTVDPILDETLVRMASIPHGTTINAQTVGPPKTFAGAPSFIDPDRTKPNSFPIADPIPFGIPGVPDAPQGRLPGVFKGLDIRPEIATPRIPQDLRMFDDAKTITQAILKNPNVVLENANEGKVITSTTSFTVATNPPEADPKTKTFGGGTANIAFLQGTGGLAAAEKQPLANASAVSMTATFFIETVQHKIVVPPFKHGNPALYIKPEPPHPGARVPCFLVKPPHTIHKPTTITVFSKQIQYTQTVNLNFAKLTWPHISVATLVPTDCQIIPDSAWI